MNTQPRFREKLSGLEPVTLNSTVVRQQGPTTLELEGELLMVDLQSGGYYGLGATGKRIWELLQPPRTLKEVRDALVSEYDVDPATCEHDLLAFATRLIDKGVAKVECP